MFRTLTAILLLGAASPALAQTVTGAPATAPALANVLPAIDAHFRQYMEAGHVPGLVYGIVRDGRLIHVGTMGVQDLEHRRPVTADSLFRIASMSKAFTALAILKLRDENRLSLDALAETYVPELRNWRYPTSDSPRIRVRDLLSHVGGLVTDNPWGDRQQILPEAEFTRMLRDGVPMSRAPGTQMEYSNFGYALLGRIITNVSGRPYDQYIRSEIMIPLGMTSTAFEIADSPRERRALGYRWENDAHVLEPDMAHGAFGAMGGVETSASDYARWVAFLLSAWPARDGPENGPVRRASVRELAQGLNFIATSERPGLAGEEACRHASAYGMGMRVAQDCDLGLALSHSGGYPGYGSNLVILPDLGVGVFAFANRTYAAPSRQTVAAALELHRAGLVAARPEPVSADLAGAYALAGQIYQAGTVEPAQDRLAMNFLMDRSASNWSATLSQLRTQAGACRTDAPITPQGAMAGTFAWPCERGNVRGYLLLAPTRPATIQQLSLGMVPPQ
ncbi:MAG TPA: serine hydrolase domain-containing protein [Allosphingosinicella sp.]|nr:serine hydrolase domain-containing protein [Allosphingosinicella sp.]